VSYTPAGAGAVVTDVQTELRKQSASDGTVYTPAGTGAVATTVQAKLRESVSVKDFGAVGDGNPETGTGTDDAVSIQAALDAVYNAGGGTVYFPAGVYMIKSGLSVGAQMTIAGSGWDASQIMIHKDAPDFTSNADAMFYLNGGAAVATELPLRYVHFRAISLNGGDNYTTNNTFNGIVARRSIYCSVVDCELKQFDRDAIKLIHNSGEASNTSFTIRNNLIRDCNSDGIVLQKVRNIEITDNIIRTQSGNGIEFEGDASERVHINGNQFNQNQVNAILCAVLVNYGYDGVDSSGSNGTNNVHIEGNFFYGNAKQNDDAGNEYLGVIHATGVEDWVVSDNKFTENDAYDLYLDINNGKVSNNYFYKSYRHGLYLTSGRNLQISDNYFINASVRQDNTYDAMYINSPTAFIKGNRVIYDSTVSTPQQRYGLNITSSASNAYVIANNVLSSGSSSDYLSSSSSARLIQNFGIGQTGTFEVNLTSNQTNIATGSDVDVLFNSEVTDVGGNFDASGYRFVAPFDGIYSVETGIRFTDIDTAATYYYARIAIYNDSDVLQRSYLNILDPNFSSDLSYLTVNLSATVKLENNWYVKVLVKQQGGTSQTDIDADSWFSGHYVADYS
jgi:hypothetical protein